MLEAILVEVKGTGGVFWHNFAGYASGPDTDGVDVNYMLAEMVIHIVIDALSGLQRLLAISQL